MTLLKNLWLFFQNQFLGMRWLNLLIGEGLAALGLDPSGRVGGSLQFFLYDMVKILLLLSVLIYLISYIQSYFPPERTKRILGNFHGLRANTLAALLGTVTPFCSCSSIPLFIGFSSAGLPLGVTFSFLVSSPLVDLGSLIVLMSVFGARIAVAYVVVGLIVAVVAGTIIEKMGMERYVEGYVKGAGSVEAALPELTRADRRAYAWQQVRGTVRKVFWYVVGGVAIGAVIHNWIPTTLIQAVLGKSNPFSVLLATALGIPMYADIFGTIPIAEALFAKGVGLGTVLSFMMAVTALSLPSMIMLSKVIKPRLLFFFVGIVSVGILLVGYLFNGFQFLLTR
ncbi:MAG TPA: permease [Candidatus Aminicenantes bacterium]|nr:permease [Candidatus Aminicenantes bacterium]HPT00692.1 permease [Candidatus Aminicenantes bacterium]